MSLRVLVLLAAMAASLLIVSGLRELPAYEASPSIGTVELDDARKRLVAAAAEGMAEPSTHDWLPLNPRLERLIESLVSDNKSRRGYRVPAADADKQACSFNVFVDGLIRSDMFLWMKEYKKELMFMPYDGARLAEENARFRFRKKHAARFFAGLANLNRSNRTVALVFGEERIALEDQGLASRNYTCVWLVDETGILAAGFTAGAKKIDEDFLADLWPDLLVDERSAARSPKKRRLGRACEEKGERIISNAEIVTMNGALKRIADRLIPTEVARVLERIDDENARLYILPVGSVQRIPFAALPLAHGHFIDKFTLLVAPSSGTIGDLAHEAYVQIVPSPVTPSPPRPTAPSALIVGDPELKWDSKSFCWPELPFARQEAEFTASRQKGATLLLGPQAKFETVSGELKRGQKSLNYIHFATHGVSDSENPADKGLLALNGRHLTGAALRALKLKFENNPIVVMSACHSATGKEFAGGIFGLVDFWWFAGAPQVVVSLWDIDDRGTNRLMKYFEESLSRNVRRQNAGGGAEFALAEAIRQLKSEEPDPTIWSSFIVVGRPSN
jgi:CHAT domain-containing protein